MYFLRVLDISEIIGFQKKYFFQRKFYLSIYGPCGGGGSGFYKRLFKV